MGYQYKKKQSVHKPSEFKKVWKSLFVETELPQGVSGQYENFEVTIKGPKGEVKKRLKYPRVTIEFENNSVKIGTKRLSQREKKIILTYVAHIKNMIIGVTKGFTYELRAVYAKFPLTLEFKNNEFVIKNLLGEKVPRRVSIPQDVTVDVKGQEVVVSGIDKEKTGQVTASIEQLTRITHLDRRVIQDGIYITKKPTKEEAQND